MDNSSLAHCEWECQYHIVFIPKYRRQKFAGIRHGEAHGMEVSGMGTCMSLKRETSHSASRRSRRNGAEAALCFPV